MTLRVLCDTNVLVSGVIASGPPSRVIEAAIDGRIELVLAEPVLQELRRVLSIKIGFDDDHIAAITTLLDELAVTRVQAPLATPAAVTGDPDDDLVLACAATTGVEVLVSGDRRHLLPVGEHNGVRIITPQALLAELANG